METESTRNQHPKNWSIMVYLAGGRDVSDEARESLLRMKEVGTTENINVIAQFDSGIEGTSTKRYLLQPLENAIAIETLLQQATAEVPAASSLNQSVVGQYFYKRLVDILPKDPKVAFQKKYPASEMIELLRQYPDRFKSSVLDFLLNKDLDGDDGNQGDTNAGDPKVLIKFVEEGMHKHEAENNMVIIWGHGNGLSVAFDFPGSPFVGKGDPLVANELSEALKEASNRILAERREKFPTKLHAIDILGFNSCSLGTIEVYYGLRGYVNFGIASEGFTPKTSWPYDKILKALNDDFAMEPKVFAQRIVEEHVSHYKGSVEVTELRRAALRKVAIQPLGAAFDLNLGAVKGPDLGNPNKGPDLGIPNKGPDLGIPVKGPDLGPQEEVERRGIDLSVCELDKSEEVTERMSILRELLTKKVKQPAVFGAILAAHAIAQSYFNKDFTDLHDFCRALRTFCSNNEIRTACKKVMDAIEAMCKKPNPFGKDVENSNGVSIFFPWGDWDEEESFSRYNGLKFLEKTKWHEFLGQYRKLVDAFESLPKTEREGREQEAAKQKVAEQEAAKRAAAGAGIQSNLQSDSTKKYTPKAPDL